MPKHSAETAALSQEAVNKAENDNHDEKIIESKCQIEANNDETSIVHMESKENQNSLPKQPAESTALPQDIASKVESDDDDDEKIVQSKHQTVGINDGASTLEKNQNSLPKQHADTTALPQEGVSKVESDIDEKIVQSEQQTEGINDETSTLEKNQNSLPKQHADTTALPQEGVNKVESDDDEKIVESKCQIRANNDGASNVHVESKENQNSLPKQNAETATLSQEEIHKVDSDNDDDDEESKCQINANNDGASSVHVEIKENQNCLPKQHAETTALSLEAINKVESDDDEKIVESKCQIEANNDGTSASGKKENKNSLPNQHSETTAGLQEAKNKMERPAPKLYFPIISDSCKEVSH